MATLDCRPRLHPWRACLNVVAAPKLADIRGVEARDSMGPSFLGHCLLYKNRVQARHL